MGDWEAEDKAETDILSGGGQSCGSVWQAGNQVPGLSLALSLSLLGRALINVTCTMLFGRFSKASSSGEKNVGVRVQTVRCFALKFELQTVRTVSNRLICF